MACEIVAIQYHSLLMLMVLAELDTALFATRHRWRGVFDEALKVMIVLSIVSIMFSLSTSSPSVPHPRRLLLLELPKKSSSSFTQTSIIINETQCLITRKITLNLTHALDIGRLRLRRPRARAASSVFFASTSKRKH
jgi:hypothetical protein